MCCGGRREPWHVWGPSCSEGSQYGTATMVDGLRQFMAWDTYSRRKIDLVSGRAMLRRPCLCLRAGAGGTARQEAFKQPSIALVEADLMHSW